MINALAKPFNWCRILKPPFKIKFIRAFMISRTFLETLFFFFYQLLFYRKNARKQNAK